MGDKTISKKAKPVRDPFTSSLGGMSIKSSFFIAPAIADDRINKALADDRIDKAPVEEPCRAHEDQPDTAREIGTVWGRFWLRARRRAAQDRAA